MDLNAWITIVLIVWTACFAGFFGLLLGSAVTHTSRPEADDHHGDGNEPR